MKYEVLMDQLFDGVRIRYKGDVIDYDGILPARVARPLDPPAKVNDAHESRQQNRRFRNTH